MNHENKWCKTQREANERLRSIIGNTKPRLVEYHNYEGIDSVAVLTQLSLNVIVYIVQNNPPKKTDEKIRGFLKCINCDLEPYLK